MSETVKILSFCSEPLGNKPVRIVPGVGSIAARKLANVQCTTARDLYVKLENLNFDERRFRVWITINCKGAKVSTIYRALMEWHRQCSTRQPDGQGIARTASPRAVRAVTRAPATRRVSYAPAAGTSRRRSAVQFNVSGTAPNNESSVRTPDNPNPNNNTSSFRTNDIAHSNNPLALFFASFSESCQNISPEFHTEFKMAILNIVRKFENKTSKGGPSPSTSHDANGSV